jgi:hypothetical protein
MAAEIKGLRPGMRRIDRRMAGAAYAAWKTG